MSTAFYAYSDGTLQAPTSTLFFQPKNQSTVNEDFKQFGIVVSHPDFKGYYYLHLNTIIYNTGDKIINLCDSLYRQGLTLTIEPVFLRLNQFFDDPLYPNQWNIANTGQYGGTVGADMHVADTWCLGYGGIGIKVAVIDEGVDLNHPDLQGRLLAGYDATGNNSGGACNASDTHGTSCAGIIAEASNQIGGQGVAYQSKIIPIRVGTGGSISDSWAASGINWAVNHNADILSNSWGGGSPSSQVDQAIQNAVQNGRSGKGSIVVFAAGNNNDVVSWPATNTNTIAVGASCECDTRKRSSNVPPVNPNVKLDPLGTSCDGEFWWGSNFGVGLDVMAPGVLITTTTNGTGYVNNFNGTSAACPNTAAVLALILSVNPNLTQQSARNMLELSCEKVSGYTYQSNVTGQPNGNWSTDAGYGRVNAFGAVARAINSITDINGADNFCSSASYTITPPTGLTVSSWSATPSGIVSLSVNGNSVTLTKVANGIVTLKAKLNSQCRGGVVITKTVYVGNYLPIGTSSDNSNCSSHYFDVLNTSLSEVCTANTSIGFNYNITDSRYSNFVYTPVSVPAGATWGASGGNLFMTVTTPPTQGSVSETIALSATGPCGTYNVNFTSTAANIYSSLFAISPNPSQGDVMISMVNQNLSKSNSGNLIYAIKITDRFGTLRKSFEYKSGINSVKISLPDLNSGVYLISVFDGKKWSSKQLIIQK